MKHTKQKNKAKCHCGRPCYMINGSWYCITRIKLLPLTDIK